MNLTGLLQSIWNESSIKLHCKVVENEEGGRERSVKEWRVERLSDMQNENIYVQQQQQRTKNGRWSTLAAAHQQNSNAEKAKENERKVEKKKICLQLRFS